MKRDDVDRGRTILRALPHEPVVLGTFGLVLHGLLDCEHAADVDILVDIEHVPAVADALLRADYTVKSWQDDVTAAPELVRLRGRVYLRAERDGLVVDVTYEGIDLASWRSDSTLLDGIRVASVDRILALKRTRNAEKDRRILHLIEMNM